MKISAISKNRLLSVFFTSVSFAFSALLPAFAESSGQNDKKETIFSESTIDWTSYKFISQVNLNTEKAGINIPSGKKAANAMIDRELPILIKDPLLSLFVNSEHTLSDIILDDTITLEQLTQIIEDGKKTPAVFTNGTLNLKTTHSINLNEISALLVKHRTPYKNPRPVEQIASRAYSGIIIDARGILPVHGEFVRDCVYPCFFPQIWDEGMNLIYERNMGNPAVEKVQGLVHYDWSDNEEIYEDRIGKDPMHIRARKVYGFNRTDPVISRDDALKILTVPENLNLLREGKIVILLDKQNLDYAVGAPEKTAEYYASYRAIKEYLRNNEDDEEEKVIDSGTGMQFLYDDLKFVADSSKLLDSELPKIKKLAEALKKIEGINNYTILVEGHTADVNKPHGQMKLSIQRAEAIVNELVRNGLPKSIFSFKGYGGTLPVATNDTAAGRAANRRVVITAKPNSITYIQKR